MADKTSPKHLLRLLAISAKLDLAWLLRDTKYAVAGIVADIVSNLSIVSSVYLIAYRFGGIGGISIDEILFKLAFSTLTAGLFSLFGTSNNFFISRIIGRGQLEHLLMQPLSLPVQLMTNGFSPFTGGSNFIVGFILLTAAIKKLAIKVTLLWILALAAYVIVTLIIIIARSYLFSCAAFYAPVAAEEISSTVINGTWLLSTFPLSGMPHHIQLLMVTLLPEGLMAWFPAMCLLGRQPMEFTVYYPFIFALFITLMAVYFFRKGLRYYVTKGSNRYVPYGFRR